MQRKLLYGWMVAAALAVALFCLVYPLWVIRPFRPQGPRELQAALAVLRARPIVLGITAAAALASAFLYWRVATRRWRAILAAGGALAVAGVAAVARINIYEKMFHPMTALAFDAASATRLDRAEKVITVAIGGEARAYPIRSMSYHHVVNDAVGGVPIVATYWTLCHTGLVWGREVDGLRLTFHLAGINNQNFLMRDEETGTFWQQISGRAISGPLAGRTLPFVASEELTLAQWAAEQPRGTVLRDEPQFAEQYAPRDWDAKMRKAPVVLSYAAPGVGQRDLMLGVELEGAARAFPYDAVVQSKLVQDHVGGRAVLLVVGPDGESVRVFRAPDGTEFYRIDGARDALAPVMLDSTGRKWTFQGCADDDASKCLERVEAIKDYWFDWRHYHPGTTVYRPH